MARTDGGWMTLLPSPTRRRFLAAGVRGALAASILPLPLLAADTHFDVLNFGAVADGVTLDTAAIQRAIDAAATAGGGTVDLPAGRYLSFTLHLRSHVTLRLAAGAVLIAATPDFDDPARQYERPESQPSTFSDYQDYGHNHWHNSLIWGENLEDVALTGHGELWGRGLQKGDGAAGEEKSGAGNKLIALKKCRRIVLRGLSLRDAGHFGVLASGVDHLTIENLRIDTRRDGIDIDCCRDVHIRGCTVNTPGDDAIVLKSSYSLGEIRSTERVTITDCVVTGSYQVGSMLDGTRRAFPKHVAASPFFIGRIKIGTETNGDVCNVVVKNCVLEGCHGLAVESEDGGHVRDIAFSHITMRNLIGPPIFVRLGARLRGPAGTQPGTIERVSFRGIDCDGASGPACSIIAGIPGHAVNDLLIEDVRVRYDGGGASPVAEPLENIATYPDPEMFGITPAQGFYIRHATRIDLRDVLLDAIKPDMRPAIWLDDAKHVRLEGIRTPRSSAEKIHATTSSSDVSVLAGS
jgi:polygalacturonase